MARRGGPRAAQRRGARRGSAAGPRARAVVLPERRGGYKASGSGAAIDDEVNLQHAWEYGAISPAGRKSRSDAIL
jgi:hypothetical protein